MILRRASGYSQTLFPTRKKRIPIERKGEGFWAFSPNPKPQSLSLLQIFESSLEPLFFHSISTIDRIDVCSQVPGIAAQCASGARRLVQFALRSVSEEALAPADPQARGVRLPSRLSGPSVVFVS